MAKFKVLLSLLIGLCLVQLATSMFCFPLCSNCWGVNYNECLSGCRSGTGFSKPGSAFGTFSCVKSWYSGYYSTNAKWQPCGRSPNIPSTYAMGNTVNVTVEPLTIDPAPAGNCNGWSKGNYNYYGDYAATAAVSITRPAVIDPVYFWQVRLIYSVITLNQWPTTDQIRTQFVSDPAATLYLDNITTTNDDNMCGGGGAKERYNVVRHEYTYSDPSGFEWNISTTNTDATMLWGITNVIVSIRLCHPYCTICSGDGYTNVCTECNYGGENAKLSGSTCNLNCLAGYGDNSADPGVCIVCDTNCKYCQDTPTNCLDCNNGYYLLETAVGVVTCTAPCPGHYLTNTTANDTCVLCDTNCYGCSVSITNCISCNPTWYLYQNACHSPCPAKTYASDATQRCYACINECTVCSMADDNCTVCETTGQYTTYLKDGTTCVYQCGLGVFESTNGGLGPNICQTCDTKCRTCDINATHCFTCNSYFYLLGTTCDSTCPFPDYFTDDATWKCLDCATYCVNMTMQLRWKNSLKEDLICDLQFSQSLSWGPTQIENFLKVTVNDPLVDLSAFNFVYEAVTSRIMRLTLSPKGYTFIYNVTFTFKTIALNPAQYNYAANGYRFSDGNYGVQADMLWFLIKAPSLSENQKSIMDSVSKFSDNILKVTTLPYVQEIKKSGLLAMLMGGAQATSTAILINTIPSQNFYEGARFWASFVFFDVPPWEQNSNKSKYVVVPSVNDLIKNARLMPEQFQQQTPVVRSLFDTNTINWRFQRTGHTSFFIFDCYINIFLIVLCWVLLGITQCCIKHKVTQARFLGMFYSFTIKVHEVTIFYISLTTLLEWIYFDAASTERWISLGLCILFNVYFLFYELYIYYDMINYPTAHIGNKFYDYYVVKYGSVLKNIRFQQYDPYEAWSPKHWFRPYNYHIMSYYKKFLMMIALPIFYSTKDAQAGALILIQLLEMARFVAIWPFKSKVRNFIRLGLQICLLVFFGTILIQSFKLPQIMSGDPAIIESAVDIFYKVGWVGFVMVWVFNIGHIATWIYDAVLGFRKSNRQLMDEARKLYYMQRLKNYEQENEDVPLALVNKWVKLGNLNNRKYDVLPDLNLRIEYFRIMKTHNGYQIDMKKLFQIFLNIEFNFQKQNNISTGKKLNKRFSLTRSLSPAFYSMIESLYQQYAITMDFEYLTIKTFQKIIQSQYQAGDKIPLDPIKMEQKVELETFAGQKKVIKLPQMLPGFPISYDDLKQFA